MSTVHSAFANTRSQSLATTPVSLHQPDESGDYDIHCQTHWVLNRGLTRTRAEPDCLLTASQSSNKHHVAEAVDITDAVLNDG